MKYSNHTLIWAIAAFVAAPILFSCSSHKQHRISIDPAPMVLTPDLNNEVALDFDINIPAGYVPSRSRLIIEPALILADSIAQELDPIIIDAPIYDKKLHRRQVLQGYVDPYRNDAIKMAKASKPYSTHYSQTIELEPPFDCGQIVAYVSVDGCGQCAGVDTLLIAELSNLSSLVDCNFSAADWIEPVFKIVSKTHFGKSEARLQFEINKWDIRMDMANNAEEMQKMLHTLAPVLQDSLSTLNRLRITGSASAEGKYDKNVKLAADRAASARNWLDEQFHLSKAQLNKISVGSHPEGWMPVVAAMHAADDPDSSTVKAIALKYPDLKTGEAEKQIRKLDCWPRIAEDYLAKDRRVIYEYEWTVRSFNSDEEMLYMYDRRPDAFNEDEFLRVATLKTEPNERIEVYETLLKYFPENEIGLNNLAILYYDNGRYDDAIELLEGVKKPTADMITTLAAAYAANDEDDRAMSMLKTIDNPQATYILGVLEAKNQLMTDAYWNLTQARDINTAIAALSTGNNDEAWSIMMDLDDDSPKACYVSAIAATRLGLYDEALELLESAAEEPVYKIRAASEPDFSPLRNNDKFIKLIN